MRKDSAWKGRPRRLAACPRLGRGPLLRGACCGSRGCPWPGEVFSSPWGVAPASVPGAPPEVGEGMRPRGMASASRRLVRDLPSDLRGLQFPNTTGDRVLKNQDQPVTKVCSSVQSMGRGVQHIVHLAGENEEKIWFLSPEFLI